MVFALLNIFTLPLKLAFEPKVLNSGQFIFLDYIIDLSFLLDIFVNFRTAFLNDQGDWETSCKVIAFRYLRTTFIIDLLATIPFELFTSRASADSMGDQDSSWTYIFGILKMGRVLRFNKII